MAVRCVSPLVLWTLVWTSGCGQRTGAEVSTKQIFFRAGRDQRVFLPVPLLSRTAQYQWLWTSQDGRHSNTSVVTIIANIWTIPWNVRTVFSHWSRPLGLGIEPIFDIAGVYVLTQTEPATEDPLARFEVFAVKTILPESSLDLGSDVSMSCALSHLPEAATLSWYRDEGPTPNTTLLYNNTAHILLHSVDQQSKGTYRCKGEMNGTTSFSVSLPTFLKASTFGSRLTLFRESSNSSQVTMICRSPGNYRKATWTRTRPPNITPVILTFYDRDSDKPTAQIQQDRFSSPEFNGYNFPLHVSPVTFEDGGTYRCIFDTYLFVFVQLTTIRVSASPPGGVAWDQPVVLTCELSEGSSVPVTLAWMRVEGRGLLVQQGVLTESRTLNMTLPSLRRDQLHWECVVFSGGLLRARVPLSLTPSQDQILPTTRPHTASGVQTVIAVACVAVLAAAMLTAALVFYCKRGRDREISTAPDRGQRRPAEGVEDEDVHYSSFSPGGLPAPAGNSASIKDSDVIYSAVNIA